MDDNVRFWVFDIEWQLGLVFLLLLHFIPFLRNNYLYAIIKE